jgi:predicted flap endonuclease-1-like 5' DNA nuclease
MGLSINELRGITSTISDKLHNAGLTNSDTLLEALKHPAERNALAVKLGIDESTLLELANRADLARVKGIGRVYSDLLEFAGVDTVAELATRVPENLFAKLQEVASQHSVIRLPSLEEVTDWINQAKALERKLFY